ncbi:hypothetical protein, partial [Arthrobacter sp. ES1]|uniref:hypothetical protein n=1 Tax=Arthrobacter sp. ES1 TaxID=1897056 RepID=UPI001CFFBD68
GGLPVAAAGTEAPALCAAFAGSTVTIRLPVTIAAAAVRGLPVAAAKVASVVAATITVVVLSHDGFLLL